MIRLYYYMFHVTLRLKSCLQCLMSVNLASYVVSDSCTWGTFCATRIIRGSIVPHCFGSKVTFENISRFQNLVERRLFKKLSVATERNAYKNKLTFKQRHSAMEMLFQKDTISGFDLCFMYYVLSLPEFVYLFSLFQLRKQSLINNTFFCI